VKRIAGHVIAASSLLAIFAVGAAGSSLGSAFTPAGDPVYEFLDHCAARGIVPVTVEARKPLTRLRIARHLMEAVAGYTALDRVLVDDLEYYLREYAADIILLDASDSTRARRVRPTGLDVGAALSRPHRHLSSRRTDRFSFAFDPVIWARIDADERKTIFRRATGIRFYGRAWEWLGYYFRFVDHVERGNRPYVARADLLEDRWGYVGPLDGGEETYYDLTEAYLVGIWKAVSITFGRDRVVWGPGWSDNLMLSGRHPPFDHLRVSFELGERVGFTHLIGSLHPWSTPGDTLYRTGGGWTRILPARKWIAAHRLTYSPGEQLLLGVGETVIWGERGLDPAYLNPLNFLFSAEHDRGDLDNVLLSGDFTLRVMKRGFVYGSLLIDDLKTSTLGSGDPSNKWGVLGGAWIADPGVVGLSGGIEYTRLRPYVYTHFFPVNRFTTWTSSLGAELPPNSDRLTLSARYHPCRPLSLTCRVDVCRHGSTGGDLDRAVPHGSAEKVHFLDGERTDWTSSQLSLRWEPRTGLVIQVGGVSGDEMKLLPDRFYVAMGYRY